MSDGFKSADWSTKVHRLDLVVRMCFRVSGFRFLRLKLSGVKGIVVICSPSFAIFSMNGCSPSSHNTGYKSFCQR